ncbi:MAG: DUF4160 domain-containing protein [Bryobacteraceae bacterium]
MKSNRLYKTLPERRGSASNCNTLLRNRAARASKRFFGFSQQAHSLEVNDGRMPRRALALILEWAQEHRAELMKDWERCANNQPAHKISPLP